MSSSAFKLIEDIQNITLHKISKLLKHFKNKILYIQQFCLTKENLTILRQFGNENLNLVNSLPFLCQHCPTLPLLPCFTAPYLT